MAIRVNLHIAGLRETTQRLLGLPGQFARARKSALGKTGYWAKGELGKYVRGGGEGWPALHPLTRRTRIQEAKWAKRGGNRKPLYWLAKFARYRVDPDATRVQIFFGKSQKGERPKIDPGLAVIARRQQRGERIAVSDKMRRYMAETKTLTTAKRPKPGRSYFPLRKSTTALVIPKRAIFVPVFRRIKPGALKMFEEKFFERLQKDQKQSKGKKS